MNKKKIGNSMIIYTFLMIFLQVTFIYISIFISAYESITNQNASIIPMLIYIVSPIVSSMIAIKLATIRKVYEEDKNLKKYILLSMLISYAVTVVALGLYKAPYLLILLLITSIPTYSVCKKGIYKKIENYQPKVNNVKQAQGNKPTDINYELDLLNDDSIAKFLKSKKIKTSNYFYALRSASLSNFFIFGTYKRFRPASYIVALDDKNIYMFDIDKKTIKQEIIIDFNQIKKMKIKNILFNKAYEIKIKLKQGEKMHLQANRTMDIIQNQENSIEELRKITKKEK